MKRTPSFQLQFPPSELQSLAASYLLTWKDEDDKALAAGRRIASGSYNLGDLQTIYKWKTKGRGISRLARNSQPEIADALKRAVEAREERSAIAVLCGLNGVSVPVASAIMTAINPDRYTVIDFRALEALGENTDERTIDFYLSYLDACRKLAKQNAVSLRELDRALWQWSKKQTGSG